MLENFAFNIAAIYGNFPVPYLNFLSIAIWTAFLVSLFFKLLWYFDQHPWSVIIKSDVFGCGRTICISRPDDVESKVEMDQNKTKEEEGKLLIMS